MGRVLKVRRVSRNADDSTALAKQDSRLDSYAEAMGHTVVGDAVDGDISGKTNPFERPQFGRWLTDPKLIASYDVILASHLDRLGRSTRWVSALLEWAETHGKTVITLDPQLDFSTPVGKLLAYIISWLAEEELRLITSRSVATQKYLRAGGYLVGKPPFGYQVVDLDAHKTLAPDPETGPRVAEAVRRYLDGQSLRTVAAWLDMSPASLRDLFRNTALMGRRQDSQGRTVLRYEGIVDRKTWTALQSELTRKSKRTGVQSGAHWLTAVAQCWHCGGVMYKAGQGGRYLRCYGTAREPSKCRNMVRVELIEKAVDDWVASHGRNIDVLETIVLSSGDADHSEELAEIEQDLRELDYDDPEFGRKQADLLAERKRIKDMPIAPDVVLEWPSDVRLHEHWPTLDSAGRCAKLLELGLIVKAKSPPGHTGTRKKEPQIWVGFDGPQPAVKVTETVPGRISIEVEP